MQVCFIQFVDHGIGVWRILAWNGYAVPCLIMYGNCTSIQLLVILIRQVVLRTKCVRVVVTL